MMKNYNFKMRNLDCANCANELERALQKIDILVNVNISFIMQKLSFDCREEDIGEALIRIKKVIKKMEPDVKIEEI